MHLRKPALAVTFVTTAVFIALGPQAMAATMASETRKAPATVTHDTPTALGDRGTVTALCVGGCYQ